MLHTVPPVWLKRHIKLWVKDLKKFGKKLKHLCLYHSNRSGYFMKNDLTMSFTSSVLLSQYTVIISSTSTVSTTSGRFGIPVDAVMKNLRECSTAGQTKELINNTNHKYDAQWKYKHDMKQTAKVLNVMCRTNSLHSVWTHTHHHHSEIWWNQYESVKTVWSSLSKSWINLGLKESSGWWSLKSLKV